MCCLESCAPAREQFDLSKTVGIAPFPILDDACEVPPFSTGAKTMGVPMPGSSTHRRGSSADAAEVVVDGPNIRDMS